MVENLLLIILDHIEDQQFNPSNEKAVYFKKVKTDERRTRENNTTIKMQVPLRLQLHILDGLLLCKEKKVTTFFSKHSFLFYFLDFCFFHTFTCLHSSQPL